MIKKKFRVAILNYPLMDPDIGCDDFREYLDLDYLSSDPFGVPLYIHIPFCSRICKFCVYSRQKLREGDDIAERYVESVIKEIKLYGRTPYVGSLKIKAIFIGGGTPTCLSAAQLKNIIDTCRDYLPLAPDIEITVECNIMSADREKVHEMRELGVSRISAGIQTFNPLSRSLLGLTTSVDDAVNWVNMAAEHSFNVVSIDLMYGLPGQACREWLDDMIKGLSLPVDHFSLYELSVLAGSGLFEEIKAGKVPACPEQDELFQMYLEADRLLKNAGFEHHMVPEYNRPGKKAQFWELTYDGYGDNLSFGASSYGFLNGICYQNIPDVPAYIQSVSAGNLPINLVSKKATYTQMMERTMLLNLRQLSVEKALFYEQYGRSIRDEFGDIIDNLIEDGLLLDNGRYYTLTPRGEYLQGDISVMFMRSILDAASPLKRQLAVSRHIVPGAVR